MPSELVPIMGMITGTVMLGFLAAAAVLIFRGPVGQAIARRLQGRAGEVEQELIGEVQTLREQVDTLEHQIGEMAERLDFAERLLSRGEPTTAMERRAPPPSGG